MRHLYSKIRGTLSAMERSIAFQVLGVVALLVGIAILRMPNESTLYAMALVASTRKRVLKDILTEAKSIQDKFRGQEMPQNEAERFEALCAEADTLQKSADRDAKLRQMELDEKAGAVIDDPVLPDDSTDDERREIKAELLKNAQKAGIAGYVTLGDFVRFSPQFKKFLDAGLPHGDIKFGVPGLLRVKGWTRDGVIPMSRDMRQAFEQIVDQDRKSLPTFGTRVIEPDRLSDMVMDTMNDELRLRDILNVVPTSSNLIEWVGRTAYTRAADIVSDGAAKPEAASDYDLRSTSVRTIAVWIPVTEQQLQDAPALINMIQTDLRYDLGKVEEEQVVWGAAAGLDFDGLENNVTAGRTSVGDTLIDKIRRSITDVRVSGYQPNGIAMHPIDWETIQLAKGSDTHYIWVVVTDANNIQRVWGLPVVETVAMLDPTALHRIVMVGDWRRGATLYDRMQASVAIGYKDDDFIRNLRTIRAEERAAFAVRRPDAFRQIVTL